jgi:predicted amidophosphoribosyltransferase
MEKEVQTVWLMIDLYCRGQHGSKDGLCLECRELFDYVTKRLEKCPLKDNKPRCSKCPVHCYKPDMREKIKAVMKYSGPRMLYRHPIMTGRHYLTFFK